MIKNDRNLSGLGKVLVAMLIVAAIAGTGWYYCRKNAKATPLGRTVTVKRGMVRSLVQATGSVVAVNSVDVSAKITGRIIEVRVRENDRVHVGQVLAVLDDSHYRALTEQADAKREVSRKNYERLKLWLLPAVLPEKSWMPPAWTGKWRRPNMKWRRPSWPIA
jgi:HlyD family secretion protein